MQINALKTTAFQAIRFGCIGCVATLVHAGVGYVAVTQLGITGLQGNVVGYLFAWWVSFFGHHSFTFKSKSLRIDALLRFIPHSVGMFLVALSITALVSIMGPKIPEEVLPLIGAGIVPVLSFLSSKLFVFRA